VFVVDRAHAAGQSGITWRLMQLAQAGTGELRGRWAFKPERRRRLAGIECSRLVRSTMPALWISPSIAAHRARFHQAG